MERFQLSVSQREKLALAVFALVIIVLASGLFNLQVINYASLSEQSENNRLRVVPITPRRGIVYDREGRRLIDNRPSYTVSVVMAERVKGVTLPNLAELLSLDTLQIKERIRRNLVNRYQPVPVKRDVAFEIIAVLEEQSRRFPGVTYQIEQVRNYPTGMGSESYTGYVGEVSAEDRSRSRSFDYRLGSMIGKKGLEKFYDGLVRGHEGTEYIEVSATGAILGPYRDKSGVEAIAGADLTLTIDLDLQKACVAALDTFCCGAIVVADPRTGEILAMMSYPSYDANIFSSVIPESLWQEITNDDAHPLLNRPLSGLYPPGSTTKFITLGAAIEEGLVGPRTNLKPCLGGYQFGNRFFKCWHLAGHGSLNGVEAIEQSCDVYMYQLGLMLGVDKLGEYYRKCGFGKATGIDLPGEADGLVPSSEYYNERYGKRGWTKGLVLNLSIGQGELLVTPLQLAQFTCGLANDGVVNRLHLIKQISKATGEVMDVDPVQAFTLPFSRTTLGVLKEGLRLVVEGKHGTAKSIKNDRYSIGGKTGTAQNPHGENHSLFVGVAPLDNPEIVVSVLVENGGHGSEVAAPIAAEIIELYMTKKIGPSELEEPIVTGDSL